MHTFQIFATGVRNLSIWLCLFLTAPQCFAQDVMWEHVYTKQDGVAAKGINLPGQLVLLPTEFRMYRLDESALQQQLSLAGLVATGSVGAKGLSVGSISVPFPDGELIELTLTPSSIMESGLASSHPEMMTFTAVAKSDPRIRGVLDYTTKGFHGLVSTPEGAVYIDPRGNAFDRYYISYYQKDYSPRGKTGRASCGVDPSAHHLSKAKALGSLPFAQDLAAAFTTGARLREYRITVAATAEYTAFHDAPDNGVSAKDDALSAIVTTINRVNFYLGRDLSIKLNLIANNRDVIFDDQDTVSLTNGDSSALLEEVQPVLDDIIGLENYDIGHIFHVTEFLTSNGVAFVGFVCDPTTPNLPFPNRKGQGVSGSWFPIGDSFDVNLVAHEIGHQFGGTHTFDSEQGACFDARTISSAVEPGSGSTIMSYAGTCGSDDLQFDADSMYSSKTMEQIDTEYHEGLVGLCSVETNQGNTEPSAVAGGTYTIPANTPFELTGSGVDADVDDVLTFSWEQSDTYPFPTPLGTDSGEGPLFRAFLPVESPTRTFPKISAILLGDNSTSLGESLPSTNREMNFKLTVRDQRGGTDDADVRVLSRRSLMYPNGFRISNLNGAASFQGGTSTSLTWDIANTTQNSINCNSVKISFSTDGGMTFPIVLTESTSNTGSATIQFPSLLTENGRIKLQCVGNIFFDINDDDLTLLPVPEIGLSGNSINIENGDTDPSEADFTDFGGSAVRVGLIGSVTRVFEISNEGEADLNISPVNGVLVSLSGSGTDDFEVIDFPANTIAPGESDTFSIRFASANGGQSVANVSIHSNDNDESVFAFAIAGQGEEPEINIDGEDFPIFDGLSLTSTLAGNYLGQVQLDGGFSTSLFEITNSESGLLVLTGSPKIEISGDNAADFTVTDNSASEITQGDTGNNFTIRFDPTALGLRSATVTILNNDDSEGVFTFPVEGTTPAVDLEVFGFAPFFGGPQQPTEEFDYRVKIENLGLMDATDVILDISLHPELTLVSTEGCVESPAANTECTVGELAAGEEKVIMVRARVNADIVITGSIRDLRSIFEVNSGQSEFRLRNNISRLSEVTVSYRQPFLTASVTPTDLVIPQKTRVTMSFDNGRSLIDAEAVEFQIDIPSGLFIEEEHDLVNTCDGSFVVNPEGSVVNFSAGRIPAEDSCELSFDLSSRAPGTFNLQSILDNTSIGLIGRLQADITVTGDPIQEEEEVFCFPVRNAENTTAMICI